MFLTIGPGKPTYTAETMWRLLAALYENKIDPNIIPIKDDEDPECDEVSVDRHQKKIPVTDSNKLIEIGYTAMNADDFCVDVRAAMVYSQDEIGGDFTLQYLYWFAQHAGEQPIVERWHHLMWLRVIKQVPNFEIS